MGLFNKKKTEETKKETAKAPAAEKKGPSIHNVKWLFSIFPSFAGIFPLPTSFFP